MQISYSGSRAVVCTASKAVEKAIGGLTTCPSALEVIRDPAFALRIGEDPKALSYGEWSVEINGSCANVCGNGDFAVLDALEHFIGLIPALAEKALALPYSHTCKKRYPVRSVRIDGVPIGEYTLVYLREPIAVRTPTYPLDHVPEDVYRTVSAAEQAAEDFCRDIGQKCGAVLNPVPYCDGMELSRCIVVGAQEDRPYGEWQLYAKDGVIYAVGGDICSLESAVSALAALLTRQDETNLDSAALHESDALPKREDYLADARAFVPCYAARFSLPEEALTLDKKEAKLADPANGLFILAHRGEHTYYPENSLEASLSAWRCGADSSEVDLTKTKDGTFVLLHDETLSRTTDADEKKGTGGLPDSLDPADWTLAQLRQLRLKDSYGKLTPFLIPTLEELFRACDGRIYLHLDKKFDYEADIFPLMRKNKTYRCLYLCNRLDLHTMPGLRDAFRDEGVRLPCILRIPQQGPKAMMRSMQEAADAAKFLTPHLELARQFRSDLRIASWMMWGTDTPLYWREALQSGFGLLMTNFPMLLADFEKNERKTEVDGR